MLDIDGLLAPISSEAPCGDDLEYDSDFGELERATQGKPEQQFGDTIVPAEEPDWPAVVRAATRLLARTKDLRVATHLTRALARTQGWGGFHEGLTLIEGLLERYWESVHPQLDPDDDNDPTLRINVLLTLCDPEATLDGLRMAPLVNARGVGAFGMRDIQIANKELPAPKDAPGPIPEPQLVEAAFQQTELDQLQATVDALAGSRRLAAEIDRLLTEHVGQDAAPDLSPLSELIDSAYKLAAAPLTERTGVTVGAEDPETERSVGEEGPATAPGTNTASTGLAAIRNRADVVRALDLMLDYYRRQEPSSPIPLLLVRAKRLVSKDFLEILEDLAPDGLSQAQVIRGPESSD